MKHLIGLFGFFMLFWLALPLAQGKELLAGQKLFQAHCAACHGINGKGTPKAAKDLKADPLLMDLTRERVVRKSNEDLRKLIASGHGKMPKQKEALTSRQIQSIIQYLRTLQKAYVLN